VGSLTEPVPPVRRYDDVTRHLIQHMDEMGFGGNDTIAHTLARAGWRVSPRTVGRVRKEKKIPIQNRCYRRGPLRKAGQAIGVFEGCSSPIDRQGTHGSRVSGAGG